MCTATASPCRLPVCSAGWLLAVLILAGCGGGGGGGAAPDAVAPDNASHTVTGTTVADVLVCADLDGDGQCGVAEQAAAATISNASGNYTLKWTGRAAAPALAMLTVAGPDMAPSASSSTLACIDANGNGVCDNGESVTNSHEAGLYRITVPAAQASAAVVFPLAVGFAASAEPDITTGNRHLTVRWAALPGAVDYEVWYQRAGTAQLTLSRGGIATAARRVHTITNLDSSQRFRVWVKARRSDSTRLVSQARVAFPVVTPSTTSDEDAAFVPITVNLPVLDISTTGNAPVVSRDIYLTGTFALYADGAARAASMATSSGGLDVRGRGNSTWSFLKKPYRLRLNASTALLGMPANRHWVLLANHADKSLLRNETVFEISRRLGMAWTPRSKFVEVWLNGNYQGNYELVEHIRTGTNRVNITTLGAGDNSEPAVTGGYLLELDRPSADTTFLTGLCKMPMVVDTPETLTAAQRAYIEGYMNAAESALLGPDFADPAVGYAAWIDVPAFVDWYLINELVLNNDAFVSSTWFYKNRGGKLALGPVWDYDLAMGNNVNQFAQDPGNPLASGKLNQICWVKRLLQDPAFVQKIKLRWQALRSTQIATLPDYIDAQAASLAQSQANNFSRWLILDKGDVPSVVVPGSFDGEVEYLRWWLQRRIEWLDTQWGP